MHALTIILYSIQNISSLNFDKARFISDKIKCIFSIPQLLHQWLLYVLMLSDLNKFLFGVQDQFVLMIVMMIFF